MRYFFDVADGPRVTEDHHGVDLPSDEEAHEQAIGLAHAIMADGLMTEPSRAVIITVRSPPRAGIYRVNLNLDVRKNVID